MPHSLLNPATRPRRPVRLAGPCIGLALALMAAPALGQAVVPGGAPSPPLELPPLPPQAEAIPAPPVPFNTEPQAQPPAVPDQADTEIDGLVEVLREPKAEVQVFVGQSRIFELKRPASRIFIANPAVANVRMLDEDQPNPKLLDVYGLSYGNTTLTIWDEQEKSVTLRLRVTVDTKDLQDRLVKVFPGANVTITQLGPQILLEGQVPDTQTMAGVLQVVRTALLGEAASLQGAGQQAQMAAANGDDVTRAAYQAGGATGGTQGGSGIATGGIPSGAAPNPVVMPSPSSSMGPGVPPAGGSGTLGSDVIINRVRVPGPRQVLLKVKIAELNRTAIRQLGVNWQRITQGAVLNSIIGNIGAKGSQLFGVFDEGKFSLFINALRQNSLAKILAEPNLIAVDGQPARFLAGGKFPYPVPQSATIPGGGTVVTIQFADFGAILQFIPHVLDGDTIRLDVEPVFSELNFSTGTSISGTTVPGINQRSARTVVELKEGQTLAIAGLLSTRTNATTNRVPALGDLPIVGPWFSQNNIETLETELVVLVTPELIDPLDPNQVPPQPGDRVLEPNDWEFYFLGRIEGRTGHPHRATIQELDPLEIMKHFRSEQQWVIGPHGHAD